MLESDNLRTASLYINNQLLSRGLLRDGQNIDFADPDPGVGLQEAMAKIMGLVNDLILRRDRDAAHRESLSDTLLALRADAQRHTTENERLSEKLVDTQRKLDGAEATERTLRQQIKVTESTVHKLKDEMAKMKTLVAQSRAACANEVRKRDRQIDSLKKAVVDAGRVRGGNKSRNVVSITVVGDTGVEGKEDVVRCGVTEVEGYSLRMETNEFLTELAASLSEENSTLLNLVRRTVEDLREMSGLERLSNEGTQAAENNTHGAPLPPHRNAGELASELEGILEHLRTILTNPSFVPIEEVEIRDTEIARLREGWERMEARWKDAVHMMEGWRRRMASSGQTVNLEELQMGLCLSPVRVTGARGPVEGCETQYQELSCVQEEEEEEDDDDDDEDEKEEEEEKGASQLGPRQSTDPAESLRLVPAPGYGVDDDDDSDSSEFQEDVDLDELEVDEPNVQVLQESTDTSMDSPPLPVPPRLSPLKDSHAAANRRSKNSKSGPHRGRPGDFTTITEEKTSEVATASRDSTPPPPPRHGVRPQRSQKNIQLEIPEAQELNKNGSTASYDSTLFEAPYESPIRSNPTRKLFSKPSTEVLRSKPSSEAPARGAKQQTPKETTQEKPVRSSGRKRTGDTTGSPVASARPVSGTRQAAKRTASAPSVPAEKKPAPKTEKPTSKSTGNTAARNRSPVRGTAAKSAPAPAPAPAAPPVSSRLPRRNPPPPQQSPITIARINAKLEASERQADAARVRAKLKAARTSRKPPTTTMSPAKPSPMKAEQTTDPVKRDVPAPPRLVVETVEEDELSRPEDKAQDQDLKPEKRRRDRKPNKAISRRRSTLNPWELDSLIKGNVDGAPSPSR
ncbi:Afadin and alpha-actinin-binding-domain-containing protein [Truncatella angustata]|uniref:Afadin and alpha-actinin-binding-domain-containing protein n=1 Tax=Truncatella angustata TaxID=152316 RepID=A0A9P8ZX77_9PEZI|nr:Afadin and alpha-actinin-binding-domain-containing protein [Truncatella angustata]KAH6652818.1 Afadin and alpha-actinin-binding-domain-containing protein [Truncatella angustata]KAH8198289.1 hypothetical protein TruAng_007539 [Truncatella angustata]